MKINLKQVELVHTYYIVQQGRQLFLRVYRHPLALVLKRGDNITLELLLGAFTHRPSVYLEVVEPRMLGRFFPGFEVEPMGSFGGLLLLPVGEFCLCQLVFLQLVLMH